MKSKLLNVTLLIFIVLVGFLSITYIYRLPLLEALLTRYQPEGIEIRFENISMEGGRIVISQLSLQSKEITLRLEHIEVLMNIASLARGALSEISLKGISLQNEGLEANIDDLNIFDLRYFNSRLSISRLASKGISVFQKVLLKTNRYQIENVSANDLVVVLADEFTEVLWQTILVSTVDIRIDDADHGLVLATVDSTTLEKGSFLLRAEQFVVASTSLLIHDSYVSLEKISHEFFLNELSLQALSATKETANFERLDLSEIRYMSSRSIADTRPKIEFKKLSLENFSFSPHELVLDSVRLTGTAINVVKDRSGYFYPQFPEQVEADVQSTPPEVGDQEIASDKHDAVLSEQSPVSNGQGSVSNDQSADFNDEDRVANTPTETEQAQSPLTIQVNVFSSAQAMDFQFIDNSLVEQGRLTMGISSINATNISFMDGVKTGKARIEATINNRSTVTSDISVQDELLSIALAMAELELVDFNPWISSSAGHRVASGQLKLDLQANVQGENLKGDAHLKITGIDVYKANAHQEKTTIGLPINLIVDQLKDKNGIIDLTIPISGTASNPKFHTEDVLKLAAKKARDAGIKNYLRNTLLPQSILIDVGLLGTKKVKRWIERFPSIIFTGQDFTLSSNQNDKLSQIGQDLANNPKQVIKICPTVADIDLKESMLDQVTGLSATLVRFGARSAQLLKCELREGKLNKIEFLRI